MGLQLPIVVAKSLCLSAEYPKSGELQPLQKESQRCPKHAKTVLHAAPEIDGRRIRCIPRRTRHLADRMTEPGGFRQHFVVEDEVIRIDQQRERSQYITREGTITGVVLRQLCADEQILNKRQKAV